MMEWCRSVDCCRAACSISLSTSIELVSIVLYSWWKLANEYVWMSLDWRTSTEDSRESQSMMEWYHSIDWRGCPCSISSSSSSSSSSTTGIEYVSTVWYLVVDGWRTVVSMSLDWRTSTQDSQESQSMMEWCHSVDCFRGSCSISSINKHREREGVSIREYVICLLVVKNIGGEEHLWMSCWIDVQVLKIHERANRWWNGTIQLIDVDVPVQYHHHHHHHHHQQQVSNMWVPCDIWLLMVGGQLYQCHWIDVQVLKIHKRANRWWNGATQLIAFEAPVQYHQSTSIEREREWVFVSMWSAC